MCYGGVAPVSRMPTFSVVAWLQGKSAKHLRLPVPGVTFSEPQRFRQMHSLPAKLIDTPQQCRNPVFSMHTPDSLPCRIIGHPGRGDEQRSCTPAPEYRRRIRSTVIPRLGHPDDRHLLFHGIEKMFSQSRPPFSAQVNEAIDHDNVKTLIYFREQPFDARQLAPEELARAVFTRSLTLNHAL